MDLDTMKEIVAIENNSNDDSAISEPASEKKEEEGIAQQEEEGGSVRGSPPMHLVLSVIPQRLGNIFSSKTMLNHHANRCLGMGEVLQTA